VGCRFLKVPRRTIITENNLKLRYLERTDLKGGIIIEVLNGT
jgi:hypothetical protein